MTPEFYDDSKTYKHDELCRDNYDIIYRASCTNLAMRGIPPNEKSIGNFWVEVKKENSPEYIDGYELVTVTENQDDSWKSCFPELDESTGAPKDYRKFLKSILNKYL